MSKRLPVMQNCPAKRERLLDHRQRLAEIPVVEWENRGLAAQLQAEPLYILVASSLNRATDLCCRYS
jgi:hypothetical protein